MNDDFAIFRGGDQGADDLPDVSSIIPPNKSPVVAFAAFAGDSEQVATQAFAAGYRRGHFKSVGRYPDKNLLSLESWQAPPRPPIPGRFFRHMGEHVRHDIAHDRLNDLWRAFHRAGFTVGLLEGPRRKAHEKKQLHPLVWTGLVLVAVLTVGEVLKRITWRGSA